MKKFIIYKKDGQLKKGVLDERMLKTYKSNPKIVDIEEYPSEILMEKEYAEKVGSIKNKKTLLG